MILGIVGKASSGKDTVASMIIEEMGLAKATQLSLAAPLKEFAGEVFNFSQQQLWGPSSCRNAPDVHYTGFSPRALLERWRALRRFKEGAPEWLEAVLPEHVDYARARRLLGKWMIQMISLREISPRVVLQTLGTDWGRAVYPDVWLECAGKVAQRLETTGYSVVVISDVRFVNEAKNIRNLGGEIWRTMRGSGLATVEGQHQSEVEQECPEMEEQVNLSIYNEGTLEDLRKHIRYLLELRGMVSPQPVTRRTPTLFGSDHADSPGGSFIYTIICDTPSPRR